MRIRTPKGLKKKLDTLWGEAIRSRGSCEVCGATEHLQAHHIITREVKALRWKLSNGLCLCPSCHTLSSRLSAHKTPFEFVQWFESKWPGRYLKLKIARNNHIKTDSFHLGVILENFKQYAEG